jgi:hypothetical protein
MGGGLSSNNVMALRNPDWLEEVCAENDPHVRIQNDNYFIGADAGQAGPEATRLEVFRASREVT